MFGKNKKKKKAVDAQAMPIEERIKHLEKTAQHNAESKMALLDAIEKEAQKIHSISEDCSCGSKRRNK